MRPTIPPLRSVRSRRIGLLEVLASGVCFGFLGILGKWGFRTGFTPGELLAFRFITASLISFAILRIFHRPALRIPRPAIIRSTLLGALGYALFSSLYFQTLRTLSVSLTVLLLYTYPVLVALGARLFFGEKLARASLLALPILALGLALLLWGDLSAESWTGFAFGLGSAVCYAGYILISSRYLSDIPAASSGFLVQAGAAIALSMIHLHDLPRALHLIRMGWAPILCIAFVGTVLPITLFLSGLQRLTSSEASVLATVEPVTAVIAASALLGESLSAHQIIGGILVLAALGRVAISPKTRAN